MLGETIDYLILRSLSHSRNIATEEDLNDRARSESSFSIDEAEFRLRKLLRRFEGHFPINEEFRYLDIGCGTGDITIALARAGAKYVTGLDIMPRNIVTAEVYAKQMEVQNTVRFICDDIHSWKPPDRYDVILSHEALEHIEDPKGFLQRLGQLVEPNGVAVLAFGPLFHSPFGDHMRNFFRVQIPWRGVIYSEKAVLRLRRERFRPTDSAACYQEIAGGLNLMRYSEFLEYVDDAGWEFDFLTVNPQLKRFGPAIHLSNLLMRMPLLKDYFALSVYAKLRRREAIFTLPQRGSETRPAK